MSGDPLMQAVLPQAERFAEVGELLIDCATSGEALERVRQTNGEFA